MSNELHDAQRLLHIAKAENQKSGLRGSRLVAQSSAEFRGLLQRYRASESFSRTVDILADADDLVILDVSDSRMQLASASDSGLYAMSVTDYKLRGIKHEATPARLMLVHMAIAHSMFPTASHYTMPIEDVGVLTVSDCMTLLTTIRESAQATAEDNGTDNDLLYPAERTAIDDFLSMPETRPDAPTAADSVLGLVQRVIDHLCDTGSLYQMPGKAGYGDEEAHETVYRPTPAYQRAMLYSARNALSRYTQLINETVTPQEFDTND